MNNDLEKGVKEKLEFFYNQKIPVHVKKKNKRFLNGELISKYDETAYLIHDLVEGKVIIFLIDIKDVEEFKPK